MHSYVMYAISQVINTSKITICAHRRQLLKLHFLCGTGPAGAESYSIDVKALSDTDLCGLTPNTLCNPGLVDVVHRVRDNLESVIPAWWTLSTG